MEVNITELSEEEKTDMLGGLWYGMGDEDKQKRFCRLQLLGLILKSKERTISPFHDCFSLTRSGKRIKKEILKKAKNAV